MTATNTITTQVKIIAVVSSLTVALLVFVLAPSAGATGFQTRGNPGNHKPVGNAGENPSGRDYGGGARGRSDAPR